MVQAMNYRNFSHHSYSGKKMVLVVAHRTELKSKKNAGIRAADMVEDQMVVGLGTGSTVYYSLERLSARIQDGLKLSCIPTSFQTAMRARKFGIPLVSLYDHDELDMTIDGADQIDRDGHMIKGRGAAHLREKCIANVSKKLIIVVDAKKMARNLSIPVPVEVLPFACSNVAYCIRGIGGIPHLRENGNKDGPVITDNGNFILDCDFGVIANPRELEITLNQIPGALCNGIFSMYNKKMTVIVGDNSGTRVILF